MFSNDESGRQVQRYIRLTYLIPELLDMIDKGKIAFTPAVELSYLKTDEQRQLLAEMLYNDCIPNLSQAQRLKELSSSGSFTAEKLSEILGEEKANQKERIKISAERVRKFFPKATLSLKSRTRLSSSARGVTEGATGSRSGKLTHLPFFSKSATMVAGLLIRLVSFPIHRGN